MGVDEFDLDLVAPFVVVADEGELDRAARRMRVGAAQLESRLRLLERQVGAALWRRLTPVAELTPAGARFLVEARAIVTLAARVGAAVRPTVGLLRVHLGRSASPLVDSLVSSFASANPGVSMRVVRESDNEAEAALLDHRTDLAFTVGGRQLPETIVSVVVERSPLGVVCPAHHPLTGRADLLWTDLHGRHLWFPTPGRNDAWSVGVRSALHRAGVDPVEVTADTVSTLRQLGAELVDRQAILVGTAALADQAGPDVTWVPLRPVQTLDRALSWYRDTRDEATRTFAAWVLSRCPNGTGGSPSDPVNGD